MSLPIDQRTREKEAQRAADAAKLANGATHEEVHRANAIFVLPGAKIKFSTNKW